MERMNERISMHNTFIAAIAAAAKENFSTMCGMEIIQQPAYVKEQEEYLYDISGVISFTGAYIGVFMVRMSEATAMTITGKMLDIDVMEIDEIVQDAMGEMANLIGGGARTKLSAKGMRFDISVPTIIVGIKHKTRAPMGLPIHVVPFLVEGKKICVEFGVKQNT